MSTIRQKIASIISGRNSSHTRIQDGKTVLAGFGKYVFDDAKMKEYLPKNVFKKLQQSIKHGGGLDAKIADSVANSMKNWAVSLGATHYTHWFQPLTGSTAEKHDSFLSYNDQGNAIFSFSGKELIQGEPDASSFPSGGLRVTFEARGYTAWDPTSPAFIRKVPSGATLCIPTVFVSYTGEALDKKTPQLRSRDLISKHAVELLHLLGNKKVDSVQINLGLEQEFFLVDHEYYNQRPDLVASGRTVVGKSPFKGQDLSDHYFGSIKDRVLAFLNEAEEELYKLGVPIKTRHNEVAPSQFEIAPIYEESNIAIDHNLLTMEMLDIIANKHNLALLLHEKPFADLNGSGKHANWSMQDSEGKNLLDPGTTPKQNLQFMLFLSAVIRGIDKYAKLLRMSVASPGNDYRLGGHEAPPAIMSIFLGDELGAIVDEIVTGKQSSRQAVKHINLGVTSLPPLPKDNTDRNRTSPFAFTGNKFEFRAVGSSQNPAGPNFILNTVVAESIDYITSSLRAKIKDGIDLNTAANKLIKDLLSKHKKVIYNGDGYSSNWQKEAKKRSLPNLETTVEAVKTLIDKDSLQLFEKYKILNKQEVTARHNIKLEQYCLCLDIEINAAIDISKTQILPVALGCQEKVSNSIASASAILGSSKKVTQQKKHLSLLNLNIEKLLGALNKLEGFYAKVPSKNIVAQAEYYRDKLRKAQLELRQAGDAIEGLVDDSIWPLPKYREMLFLS